jgi:hypothetical protein
MGIFTQYVNYTLNRLGERSSDATAERVDGKQSAPQLLDETFLVELLHQAGIDELLGAKAARTRLALRDIIECALHRFE